MKLFVLSPQLKPKSEQLINKLKRDRMKDVEIEKQLHKAVSEKRNKMLLEANLEEEKNIKKLEKLLQVQKARDKNRLFTDDGLDCIFFIILFTFPMFLPLFLMLMFFAIKDK